MYMLKSKSKLNSIILPIVLLLIPPMTLYVEYIHCMVLCDKLLQFQRYRPQTLSQYSSEYDWFVVMLNNFCFIWKNLSNMAFHLHKFRIQYDLQCIPIWQTVCDTYDIHEPPNINNCCMYMLKSKSKLNSIILPILLLLIPPMTLYVEYIHFSWYQLYLLIFLVIAVFCIRHNYIKSGIAWLIMTIAR